MKRIFAQRGFGRGASVFLICACLLLMWSDKHIPMVHRARQSLSVIVWPLQTLVNSPVRWLSNATMALQTRQTLSKDNAALTAQVLSLQVQLQRLNALERENQQLKALDKVAKSHASETRLAGIMALDTGLGAQQMMINQGGHDGIVVGQAVVDAFGLVGQVMDVSPYRSTVLLLTDPRAAVPIVDQRTGYRAIAVGQGAGQPLALLYVTDSLHFAPGDLCVTSGFGGHFPDGYPVGRVSHVVSQHNKRFASVSLKPLAQFERDEHVLLLKLPKSQSVSTSHHSHPPLRGHH